MESLPLFLIVFAILIVSLVMYGFLSSTQPTPTNTTKEPSKTEINQIKKNIVNPPIKEELKKEKAELPKEEKKVQEDTIVDNSKLLDRFCEYVKQKRVIHLEQYAKELKTTKEEAIKQLREMEAESEFMGFLNNDEYFYLTLKEVDLLDNLTKKRNKKYTESEINSIFKEIVSQGR